MDQDTYLNELEPSELECYKAKLVQMCQEGASVDRMIEATTDLLISCPFVTCTLVKGTAVFRARKFNGDERFCFPNDLWHPPKDKVNLGRANRARQPILYVGQDGITAIHEIDLQPGEQATVIRYEVVENLMLQVIGLNASPIFKSVSDGLEKILQLSPQISDRGRDNVREVHKFLAEQFNRDSDVYALTTAITERLISAPDCSGIAYRSYKANSQHNFALKPADALVALTPRSADVVRFEGRKNGELGFYHILSARRFFADGSFAYKQGEKPPPDWLSAEQGLLKYPYRETEIKREPTV